MDAQRHGEDRQQGSATETKHETGTAQASGPVIPAPRTAADDSDLSALTGSVVYDAVVYDAEVYDAVVEDTVVTSVVSQPRSTVDAAYDLIDAEPVDEAPPRPSFESFTDDEPGGAFFASFDHGPMPSRRIIDEPVEVIEGEEDEDAAPVLRIGGWLQEFDIEPPRVPLADSVTTLLPVLAIRPPSEYDLSYQDLPAAPVLNLPVRQRRAWLLPGGRNGNLTDDWAPQHKHPRTIRLRYAAAALAALGVTAVGIFNSVGGASAPSAESSPGPTVAASGTTDSAGGVMAGGSSPTASPTAASTPRSSSGATPTGGRPTGSPTSTSSPLGLGPPGGGSPPPPTSDPVAFDPVQFEAEWCDWDGWADDMSNSYASGGRVVRLWFGQGAINLNRFSVPQAGTYHLTVWYATGVDRTAQMTVNGSSSTVSFSGVPGDSGSIASITVAVTLTAGRNSISFSGSVDASGNKVNAPDFDRFLVQV